MYTFDPTAKTAVTAEEFVAPLVALRDDQLELSEVTHAMMEGLLKSLPALVKQNKELPTTARPLHLFSVESVIEETERPLTVITEQNTLLLKELRSSVQRIVACSHAYREQSLRLIYEMETIITNLDKEIAKHKELVQLTVAELYVG